MILLTEHFLEEELNVQGEVGQVRANALWLCQNILEPIRAYIGEPVIVDSGFRTKITNDHVGGVLDSYHLYYGTKCAADIRTEKTDLVTLFDWLRIGEGAKLPYDKIILEINADNKIACIHIQGDSEVAPRSLAYVGHTGDLGGHKYDLITKVESTLEVVESICEV